MWKWSSRAQDVEIDANWRDITNKQYVKQKIYFSFFKYSLHPQIKMWL